MKVLLNDGLAREGIQLFEEFGIETDSRRRDPASLVRDIGEFDALVVRSSTKVTKEVIQSGAKGNLKIVGRAGVGYDNIAVKVASENGIIVKYAPFGNTNAVAELTICLILNVSRNIPQAHKSLKNGVWEKNRLKGSEISHKTLGILGCGKIGHRVAELARRGFDMDVIGCDLKPWPSSVIKYMPKEEVIKRSDYISVHTGGKEVIVGEKELSMMKPTTYLINTSRGANVDEKALYNTLKEKRIAGAALDVYPEEPKKEGAAFRSKLRELDNVIFSSHLGASTKEAQRETSVEIARVVLGYLLGADFSNAVNADENIEFKDKPVYNLFIHHRDVPGVFAEIDKVLADNQINIRANYSRQIGKDGFAVSVYVLNQKVTNEIIKTLRSIDTIYNVKA